MGSGLISFFHIAVFEMSPDPILLCGRMAMRPRRLAGCVVAFITLALAGNWAVQGQGAPGTPGATPPPGQRDLLYVGSPGSWESNNDAGILVFDVRHNYQFVKRISTWNLPASQAPDESAVKGIAASAVTGMLYVSIGSRLAGWNLS